MTTINQCYNWYKAKDIAKTGKKKLMLKVAILQLKAKGKAKMSKTVEVKICKVVAKS